MLSGSDEGEESGSEEKEQAAQQEAAKELEQKEGTGNGGQQKPLAMAAAREMNNV